MSGLLYSIYQIIFILPAYVANGAPVIFGGGMPLDLKRKLFGKRVFGDHKTIRGLVFGLLAGFTIALVESQFLSYMLATGILLSIGAHIGDLVGSFIKRQMNIKEGAHLPIVDQYLFLVFALIVALPLGHLPGIYGIVFIIVLTGLLHIAANRLAYMLKIKKVPW